MKWKSEVLSDHTPYTDLTLNIRPENGGCVLSVNRTPL